jgi:hypothetical protein
MSDSLKATVIVSVWVLTISTRPLLLDDEDDPVELLEPPRLPAALDPVPALELAALEPVELLDDPELLPDTESPGEMLCTETTVPVAGA